MKKLILAVMLSVLLCGFGTAYAVLGVDDAVPGGDVVFPVICQVGGGLDTLWAVAEVLGFSTHFPDSTAVLKAQLVLSTKDSIPVHDESVSWTKWDVITDLCSGVVSRTSDDNKPLLIQTIGGIQYYVGYVTYFQTDAAIEIFVDRLVPWVYLVDLNKGFASGFNGVASEMGLGAMLGEARDLAPVTAAAFFPRFFFLNNNAQTWNWWTFLAGRNELSLVNPIQYSNVHRHLNGFICDEQENCYSMGLSIPYEVNIINVLPIVPNDMKAKNNFPTNSMGGFAALAVQESGQMLIPFPVNIAMLGTINIDVGGNWLDILPGFDDTDPSTWFYSMYGWSYQREGSNAGAALSWDVIHPIHRWYIDMTGFDGLGYISGDTTVNVGFSTIINAD